MTFGQEHGPGTFFDTYAFPGMDDSNAAPKFELIENVRDVYSLLRKVQTSPSVVS